MSTPARRPPSTPAPSLLGSFPHYGLLRPGDSYTETQLVTLPSNLLGNYNLFIVTNATNTVYQPTTNNTSAPVPSTMNLQLNGLKAAVSDLQATSVSGPTTAQTGDNVTVTWSVQNNGPGATDATTWDDAVWLSTTPTLGGGGTAVFLGQRPAHQPPVGHGLVLRLRHIHPAANPGGGELLLHRRRRRRQRRL